MPQQQKQYIVRNPRGHQVGVVFATSRSMALMEANRTYGKGPYIINEA